MKEFTLETFNLMKLLYRLNLEIKPYSLLSKSSWDMRH